MRIGMSWPTGRGRRMWISVGWIGLLLLGPVWLAYVTLYVAVLLVVVLAGAGWRLITGGKMHPATGQRKPKQVTPGFEHLYKDRDRQ